MAEPEPCKTCGGSVRIVNAPIGGSGSLASPAPDMGVRVCTRPECPTNGPDKSMADVV